MVVQYQREPDWRRQSEGSREHIRRRIAKTGSCVGGKCWTDAECQIVRDLYPDYVAMRAALPHRTRRALEGRASILGAVERRHVWTGAEVVKLRKLFAQAKTHQEILAAFPGFTFGQLKTKAWRIGAPHRRRPYMVLGVPALDAIRQRVFEERMTLVDLDDLARTKSYFQRHGRRVRWKPIGKAVALLEGELIVDWGTREPKPDGRRGR